MSKIALSGNASGTGTFTIASPNSNSDRTLTLPDNSGTVLTNATTTGFPAGSVLQVVSATYAVQTDFTAASYTDTGLTATITPSSATSRILVLANQVSLWRTGGSGYGELRLVRDATALARFEGQFNDAQGGSGSISFVDSPATTSAVTYKTQCFASAPTIQLQRNSGVSTITLLEIAG
jgi:hypothetical protein